MGNNYSQIHRIPMTTASEFAQKVSDDMRFIVPKYGRATKLQTHKYASRESRLMNSYQIDSGLDPPGKIILLMGGLKKIVQIK